MADPALSKEIVRYNLLQTWAFQFNVTKAPFDNKLVRQAFSCAIDRAAFINNVRGGVGKVAYSWIPPGMPGYDANLGKDYDFNPTKAKDLLAQAGYSDVSKLPAITFTYSNTGQNPTIAQFLQGQIKDNLGITITLDPQEPKAAFSLSTPVNINGRGLVGALIIPIPITGCPTYLVPRPEITIPFIATRNSMRWLPRLKRNWITPSACKCGLMLRRWSWMMPPS